MEFETVYEISRHPFPESLVWTVAVTATFIYGLGGWCRRGRKTGGGKGDQL